jgi:hypothetical protein
MDFAQALGIGDNLVKGCGVTPALARLSYLRSMMKD